MCLFDIIDARCNYEDNDDGIWNRKYPFDTVD